MRTGFLGWMRRSGVRWAIGLAVVVAAGAISPNAYAEWGPSPGVVAERRTPAACGGVVPAGYAVHAGVPHSTIEFFVGNRAFNPQTVALFTAAALKDTRNTAARRLCWAGIGAAALIANSRTFVTPQGAAARSFPYLADFRAHPATPLLRAPWYSALGQASSLDIMVRMYTATKDPTYLYYARQAFEVFTVRSGPYAVVSEERGMTYLQEYVTEPATYVLNGNNEALFALASWSRFSGDERAAALVAEVSAALERTLPLHEFHSPNGLVSSYDLLRGTLPAAPLRVSGDIVVHQAQITDGSGPLSTLALPVAKTVTGQPNLLVNPRLSTSGASRVPTGWRSATPAALTRVDSPFSALRLTSTTASATFYQDIPAKAVRRSTRYRLSVNGALFRRGATASSSLLMSLVATCPAGGRMLARSQIRWTGAPNWIDVVGTTPASTCPLRVMVTAQYPASTTVDIKEISLSVAEDQGRSVVPAYPVSILDHPTLFLGLTYTGSGSIQAYLNGRWWTLTGLPTAARSRIDYRIPGWIQGRNVNLRYHEHHVQELDELHKAIGCTICKLYGRRWLDVAPSEWGRLTSLS